MKKIVILYHGNCADGFGGAWSAWKKFGSKADYIEAHHHTPPPKGLKNKEIYFVDFVYAEDLMKKIIKESRRVVIIDHHISAKNIVRLVKNRLYALNHSGAALAWRYFNSGKTMPKLLRHIEDVDLWKFKLTRTKEVIAFINLFKFQFKLWDKIADKLERPKSRKEIIEKGSIALRYEERLVERLAANAELVEFAGYRTLAVNSPVLMSEIGHALVKKMPPIGIIWHQKNGKKVFSLRSDGKVDAAKIAERFGGGGHKAAAGFSLPANKLFPWKTIKC